MSTRRRLVLCIFLAIAGLIALPAVVGAAGDGDEAAGSNEAATQVDLTIAAAESAVAG